MSVQMLERIATALEQMNVLEERRQARMIELEERDAVFRQELSEQNSRQLAIAEQAAGTQEKFGTFIDRVSEEVSEAKERLDKENALPPIKLERS